MTTYPDDEDGAVLAALAEQGVDMSSPLEIELAILAANEESANAIQSALKQAGYPAEVEYDEGEPDEEGEFAVDDEEFGPSWSVYVALQMVPEYQEFMRLQEAFQDLAEPHQGTLDGWGVMLGE